MTGYEIGSFFLNGFWPRLCPPKNGSNPEKKRAINFFCSTFSGSEERYRHEFQGYLAGLSLLTGVTENSEVLRCLHQCAESLQVPATSSLAPGMEMVTDNKGSRVIVDGPSQKDMATLVRQVIGRSHIIKTHAYPGGKVRFISSFFFSEAIANSGKKESCFQAWKSKQREEKFFSEKVLSCHPSIHPSG